MQADANFFGFAPNASRRQAMRLYEESESYGNSKAMLALGRIHERGLVDEHSKCGGAVRTGALELAVAEPDFSKAFEYYD